MPHRRLALGIVIFFLLTACLTSAIPPITPSPVSDTTLGASASPSSAAPQSTAAPGNTVPANTPVPAPPRAQYSMNVTMDYAAKSVSVDEIILYPNETGQALNDMVLSVEAHLPKYGSQCFSLHSLLLNGTPISDYTLDENKLAFSLPAALQPQATVTLRIQYDLKLPPLVQQHGVRPQIFGYSSAQMNLTDWYPFVVPFINGAWVLHEDWYYGEHLVYDSADFDVNLKFTDPANPPLVAASGAASPNGEWTRYALTAGRAFALSASREYKVISAPSGDATVYSYYFPPNDRPAQAVLDAAVRALQVYAQHYGSPYSHATFSIVMGDFNDGMEFSGLFFLPHSAYNLYNGTPENLLTTVTVHETAHQWWFEQVADDQATQPWLDEAFAAYSEHIFYESVYPKSLNWWWAYWAPRVGGTESLPWVDISVYEGQGFIPYTNTVYLRGAHFLDDLRGRMGDAAFFAFLQDYVKQENGRITTTADFFRVLRADTQTDLSDLMQKYFKNSY